MTKMPSVSKEHKASKVSPVDQKHKKTSLNESKIIMKTPP